MPATGASAGGSLTKEQRRVLAQQLLNTGTDPAVVATMAADPKTKIAKALAAQASSTAPVAAGGWGLAEGFGRVGSGLLGHIVDKKLDEKAAALEDRNAGAYADALAVAQGLPPPSEQKAALAAQNAAPGVAMDEVASAAQAPAAAAAPVPPPVAPPPVVAPPGTAPGVAPQAPVPGPAATPSLPADFASNLGPDAPIPAKPDPMRDRAIAALMGNQPPQGPLAPSMQAVGPVQAGAPPANPISAPVPMGRGATDAIAGTAASDELAGGTKAITGNNPAGIIDSPFAKSQPGYVGGNGRFAAFDTLEHGAAAQATLLRSYIKRGFDTPAKIARRWAPKGDGANDPVVYAASIAKQMGIGVDDKITRQNLAQFQQLQAKLETGAGVAGGGATDTLEGGAEGADTGPDQVPVPELPAAPEKPMRPAERAKWRSSRLAMANALISGNKDIPIAMRVAMARKFAEQGLEDDSQAAQDQYRTETGLDREEYQAAVGDYYNQRRDLSKQQIDERMAAINHNYKMVQNSLISGDVIDDETADIGADIYYETNQFPPVGTGRLGTANRKKILEAYKNKGYTGAGQVQNAVALAGDKSAARAAGTMGGKADVSARELERAVPLAKSASKAVPRSKFVPLNKFRKWSHQQVASNPEMAALALYVNQIGNIYDVLAGRGGTDEGKRKEAREKLDMAQSPEAFNAALDAIVQESRIVIDATQDARRDIRGQAGSGTGNDDVVKYDINGKRIK